MQVHLDTVSTAHAPISNSQTIAARSPKGLSALPTTLHFSSSQNENKKGCWNAICAFFSSIWKCFINYITCKKAAASEQNTPSQATDDSKKTASAENTKPVQQAKETSLETATKKMGNFVESHLNSDNLKKWSAKTEATAAIIVSLDGKVVDCHYDYLSSENRVESFQKAAIQKLDASLAARNVKENSQLAVTTIFIENSQGGTFNLLTQCNTHSSSNTEKKYSMNMYGSNASAKDISAGTVAKIVMMNCGNDKENPQAVALYKFVGEKLKSSSPSS